MNHEVSMLPFGMLAHFKVDLSADRGLKPLNREFNYDPRSQVSDFISSMEIETWSRVGSTTSGILDLSWDDADEDKDD